MLIYTFVTVFTIFSTSYQERKEWAHAILIRALEPSENIAAMLHRRGMKEAATRLTAGPGVLSQAMGISRDYSGTDLLSPQSPIWLEDVENPEAPLNIVTSPRIGVDYAEECAAWEWRFYLEGNSWVSKRKLRNL